MKIELQDALAKMYPEVFPKGAYLECGDGWFSLISAMCSEIGVYLSQTKEEFSFSQIKEKFGTLKAYTDYSDDVIDKIIYKYESLSAHICETCGSKGTLKSNHGWSRVSCNMH